MQSIVVTLGYFPWALCRAGGISQCYRLCIFLQMKYLHLTLIRALYKLIFCSTSNKQIYSQVRTQKKKYEGPNLKLEPWAKLLSWPRSSMQGRVILGITLCFLLGARCPAHGLCLAAAQCHCGKERSTPCWLLLPHPLKGERLWGCCLVLRFPGLLLMCGAPQNETGNLYLLALHSVTVLVRECLFICLYCTVFWEGRLFGPQKSHATRTCTYLIRG